MRIFTPNRSLVLTLFRHGNPRSGHRLHRLTFWQVCLLMLIQVPVPGSVVLEKQTISPSIFATLGSSKNFLQYIVSSDTWTAKTSTSANVGAGGGARSIGSGNISVIRGSNTNYFWIYNISTNTWNDQAVTPGKVNTGGTLSDFIGSGNIAALRGAGTKTFWIYNISSDSWSSRQMLPVMWGTGGLWYISVMVISLHSEALVRLHSGFTTFPPIHGQSRQMLQVMLGLGGLWYIITETTFTHLMERIPEIFSGITSQGIHGPHWQPYPET